MPIDTNGDHSFLLRVTAWAVAKGAGIIRNQRGRDGASGILPKPGTPETPNVSMRSLPSAKGADEIQFVMENAVSHERVGIGAFSEASVSFQGSAAVLHESQSFLGGIRTIWRTYPRIQVTSETSFL